MVKKIAFIIIVIICLIVINDLIHSIFDLLNKQTILITAQKQLVSEQKQNVELKKELSEAQSNQFVEKEARDKLFLVKPGEQAVVVLQTITPTPTLQQIVKPVWQQWFELFF